MTRTASIGSRVPPAVTTTATPSRSRGSEAALDLGHDALGAGQAPLADVASGQTAGLGLHHHDAASAQRRQVLLDRRVLPHLGVHRRAHDHRRPGRQQGGREQVGRDAGGIGADQAGRGGDDHDQVGALAEPGVRDRIALVPEAGLHRLRGQCRHGGAPDEVLGSPRHHRDHVSAGVDQAATDLDRLVGGDAAGDTEHDAPPRDRAGQRALWLGHRGLRSQLRERRDRPIRPRRWQRPRPARRRPPRTRRPRGAGPT